MRRAASLALCVVLAACARSPDDARPRAESSLGTATELAAVDAPALPTGLRETAQEYIHRRASAAPFEPGAIASGAVGAIVSCVTCHGENGEGIPALGTPRIGGMPEWYLARELKYFEQGVRAASVDDVHGTQMRALLLLGMRGRRRRRGLRRQLAGFALTNLEVRALDRFSAGSYKD